MNRSRWLAGLLLAALAAAPLSAQQKVPPAEAPPPPVRPAPPAANPSTGRMSAAQVEALMQKVKFAGYRINDLLVDVHPEQWKKLPPTAVTSFQASLAALHEQMKSLKAWREQFQKRPQSVYLGYEVFAAINAVLPRLEGVARTVGKSYNASYGAQFDEVAGHLFDLQQHLGGYLGFLLRDQDQVITALENNVASCQRELGEAMRGRSPRARGVRNARPIRPYRRTRRRAVKRAQKKVLNKTAAPAKTPPEQ